MGNAQDAPNKEPPRAIGVRVVCVSDTHGRHRDVSVPDGDILVHAGDFTHFGKKCDALDFNEWLGTLPHPVKVVVNGNHEANAPWKGDTSSLLSNATFLRQQAHCVEARATRAPTCGRRERGIPCAPAVPPPPLDDFS